MRVMMEACNECGVYQELEVGRAIYGGGQATIHKVKEDNNTCSIPDCDGQLVDVDEHEDWEIVEDN